MALIDSICPGCGVQQYNKTGLCDLCCRLGNPSNSCERVTAAKKNLMDYWDRKVRRVSSTGTSDVGSTATWAIGSWSLTREGLARDVLLKLIDNYSPSDATRAHLIVAEVAVAYADALIAELAKKKEGST